MPRARKERTYRQASFLQTLYSYDGPKLILMKTEGTSLILAVAILDERFDEPFFGVEITRDQFYQLADEEFGVQYVFLKPALRSRFTFDLADLDERPSVNLIPAKLSPETIPHLPGRTFFAGDFTEEIALMAETPAKAEERIEVDGNWEISDFGDLYGGYSDLYSFTDGLRKFQDTSIPVNVRRTVKNAFDKQWQGGGSYGSFYRAMRGAQSPRERLSLGGFEYHSPGWVDLEGQRSLLDAVTAMLQSFAGKYLELSKEYNTVYRYLQQNKLLSLPAGQFDKTTDLAKNVGEKGAAFGAMLPGADWKVLLHLADGDPLIATKVLLSLFRRLNRLNDFQLQGRVTF